MCEDRLSNDVFMSELTLMFHEARDSGDVVLTVKKYDGRTVPYPKARTGKKGKHKEVPEPLPEPVEYKCLIRAKSSKKHISSEISPIDALRFQLQFAQFMRSSMDGLKKEKKPRKKTKKATQ